MENAVEKTAAEVMANVNSVMVRVIRVQMDIIMNVACAKAQRNVRSVEAVASASIVMELVKGNPFGRIFSNRA